MSRRFGVIIALAISGALASAGAAQAETIGTTTPPASATTAACFGGFVLVQQVSDPATSYNVPANFDQVTGWQINTTGATAGAAVTFVVLHPTGATTYDVVGTDSETLPNPLPVSGIASFTLPTPIVASAGDTLGLYIPSGGAACYFSGGTTPSGAHLDAMNASSTPTTGQHLSEANPPGPSPGGYELNVAATVAPPASQDVGVATAVAPAGAVAGSYALLNSTVSNAGPPSLPVTFVDQVPAGLTIASAVAGDGSCSVAGQTVTCTINGLAPGQSAPVSIVVTPAAAGTYTNAVSASSGIPDPNTGNNTASASLAVSARPTPAPTPKCVVPNLKRVPSATAKKVLKLLGCKVGKTRTAHSSSVAKGLVIKTSPKAGTYAAGRTVALTVSSGKAKKK